MLKVDLTSIESTLTQGRGDISSIVDHYGCEMKKNIHFENFNRIQVMSRPWVYKNGKAVVYATRGIKLRSRDNQAFYSHSTTNKRSESSLYYDKKCHAPILPGPKMVTILQTGEVDY